MFIISDAFSTADHVARDHAERATTWADGRIGPSETHSAPAPQEYDISSAGLEPQT